MKMTTVLLIALFAQAATAAAITRVDAKKLLKVTEGRYAVVKTDSALTDDLICTPKTISTVKWVGPETDALLQIGGQAPYADFNSGLHDSAVPGDKDKCVYKDSTLAEDAKLIADSYENCASHTQHSHTEITFAKDTIVYTVKVSVTKNGKTLEAPATCTLKLKP